MTVLAAEAIDHTSNDWQLILAALLGIATVVVLITWLKVHPFLALIYGSFVLGVVAAVSVADVVTSFSTGVGTTVGGVGLLIALGAMIGGMLAESGGANSVVHAFTDRVSPAKLPWVMGGVAALIGIPLFFEVGVVLLVPIVLLAAVNARQPVLRVGIPALAGLSVLHGFVPPHPGPLVAIDALGADLGRTLIFGLIVAIPTVIIAGPMFGNFISERVRLEAPRALVGAGARVGASVGAGAGGLGAGDEPREATYAGRPATGGGGVDDPRDVDAIGARDGVAEPPRRRPGLGAT